jgi:hypothetical protein
MQYEKRRNIILSLTGAISVQGSVTQRKNLNEDCWLSGLD